MPSRALLITVWLLDGRYHGVGDWPPAPFRLFQALVAGAYSGRWRAEPEDAQRAKDAAFTWLEALDPPHIAAPAKLKAPATTYFVPNNDLDAVGGDLARIAEIRAGKIERPLLFASDVPFLYAWPFDDGQAEAQRICGLAERLHTLGSGVDPAFAVAEIVGWDEADTRLLRHGGTVARPTRADGRDPVPCPVPGSLASLKRRFEAQRDRFATAREGRSLVTLFRQPPKPAFRGVVYDRPPRRFVFELKPADGTRPFQPVAQGRAAEVVKSVRDGAAARLQTGFPAWAAAIDKTVVGRGAGPADKERRVRILPLPSIGMEYTAPEIRRVLVEVPPDFPFSTDDLAWAVSGLSICDRTDPKTGEVREEGPLLVPAEDDSMLRHYGIQARPARRWQTVTPAALPVRRPAGKISGDRRANAEAHAAAAVADALRHAGYDPAGIAVRVQSEPFHLKGLRAEAFAADRFDSGTLRHVEIRFPRPVRGPLVIGNGRWLGLGLMRPVTENADLHLFALDGDRPRQHKAETLTRALRRAVMARVQAELGLRAELAPFFTGHVQTGDPARSGKHEHLFFLADDADGDGRLDRVAVIAPQLADRTVTARHGRELRLLEQALAEITALRAGPAGALHLVRIAALDDGDPVFGRARFWVSRTPYRPTRHPREPADAANLLRWDVLLECERRGLPRPEVEVVEVATGRRGGIAARLRIEFSVAVSGPLLLGAGSHFGAGLFGVAQR
jgi:CRISPR-associated protein Csb2